MFIDQHYLCELMDYETENYQRWSHFLSSIQKVAGQTSPEKRTNLLLGKIDCFSTSLSKKLLQNCGESFKADIVEPLSCKFRKREDRIDDISHDRSNFARKSETVTASKNSLNKEVERSETVTKNENNEPWEKGKTCEFFLESEKNVCNEKKDKTDIDDALYNFGTVRSVGIVEVDHVSSHSEYKGKLGVVTEEVEMHPDVVRDSTKLHVTSREVTPLLIQNSSVASIKDNLQIKRKRQRYTYKNKRKNDIDLPCSQWDIHMLARYVNFEETVGKIISNKHCDKHVLARMVQRTKQHIFELLDVICPREAPRNRKQLSADHFDLTGFGGMETDVRIVLDAFLVPFAKEFGLRIETEKSFNNSTLPHCKFDYRIHHGNDIIGVVEAKSRSRLGPESVVQGIIQLAAIQAEVYASRQKHSCKGNPLVPFPLFNIISDGFRFIFIQLYHKKLLFDHQSGRNIYGESASTIRFYTVDSVEKLEEVLCKMAGFVQSDDNGLSNELRYEEGQDENWRDEEDGSEEDVRLQYQTDKDGVILLD